MVATGRETVIQLPPADPRFRGLLTQTAREMDAVDTTVGGTDRLGQGVTHTPWGCAPLKTGNLNCGTDVILNGMGAAFDTQNPPQVIDANVEGSGGDYSKTAALLDFDAVSPHPAFKLVDGLQCTTLSLPDANSDSFTAMTARLNRRMRVLASAALTGELITGWASGGPSLSDATPTTPAFGMAEAATQIEVALADSLLGLTGIVFIPPALLHLAIDVSWVHIEGGQLFTATGHRVVSDAGHTGLQGPTTPGMDEWWLFGSGDISYRVSDTRLIGEGSENLDVFVNVRRRLAEAFAQLAFDPCPVTATLVTVTTGS